MALKITDAMTRRIVYCTPTSTVRDIAALMREKNISCVIVLENNTTCGIVTQHDLVSRVMAAGLDPKRTVASEVMSKPVVTVSSSADLTDAARIMRDKRIKKLIAVKDGVAEGIITSFDIIVAAPAMRFLLERTNRGR